MNDYRVCKMNGVDSIKYYVVSSLLLFSLGMLFYRSLPVSLLCCLGSLPLRSFWVRHLLQKRREKLSEGFRDMLYLISGSVAAGRQMPAALQDAAFQLATSWGGESDIAREAANMSRQYLEVNEDLDLLWEDLAKRSGIREIEQFAESYRVCRTNGGDLEDVCFRCASVLLEKLAFKDELKALTSQRKLDIAILAAMPVLVLLMLNLLSYSYIEVMYTAPAGRMIMTSSLVLMVLALLWSLKIAEVSL